MSGWKDEVGDGKYDELIAMLRLAYLDAASGKGVERHDGGEARWSEQIGCRNARTFGIGSPLGQISKKCEELVRLEGIEPKLSELRGIIVYAAMAMHELIRQEALEEQARAQGGGPVEHVRNSPFREGTGWCGEP